MKRLRLSYRRLMLALLTKEERYHLYRVVSNGWIMMSLNHVCAESNAILELRKKGLVRFTHLAVGRIHFIGQRSPNDQVMKIRGTQNGVQLSNRLLDLGLA